MKISATPSWPAAQAAKQTLKAALASDATPQQKAQAKAAYVKILAKCSRESLMD
jgi:endonuclease YncB( thermonuclease family)